MTSATTERTFLGKPITGTEPERSVFEVEQWSADRLASLLRTVFGVGDVVSVSWSQYTPYFNDGDACVFRVRGVKAVLADMSAMPSYAQDGAEYYELEGHPAADVVRVLDLAMSHFEEVLYEAFGDHCLVTAYRDRFEVESYEHD